MSHTSSLRRTASALGATALLGMVLAAPAMARQDPGIGASAASTTTSQFPNGLDRQRRGVQQRVEAQEVDDLALAAGQVHLADIKVLCIYKQTSAQPPGPARQEEEKDRHARRRAGPGHCGCRSRRREAAVAATGDDSRSGTGQGEACEHAGTDLDVLDGVVVPNDDSRP